MVRNYYSVVQFFIYSGSGGVRIKENEGGGKFNYDIL
jgi:hypothetical protein